MSYTDYLKELLRPLGVYDVDAPFNGGELTAAGEALDGAFGALEEVERELLAGGAYTPDTPAAIVYKATWPDEQVLRCTVGTLARTARDNCVTRTALITVGDFLGTDYGRSMLYDPAFTHSFREATV